MSRRSYICLATLRSTLAAGTPFAATTLSPSFPSYSPFGPNMFHGALGFGFTTAAIVYGDNVIGADVPFDLGRPCKST